MWHATFRIVFIPLLTMWHVTFGTGFIQISMMSVARNVLYRSYSAPQYVCDSQRSIYDLSSSKRCLWHTTFNKGFVQLSTMFEYYMQSSVQDLSILLVSVTRNVQSRIYPAPSGVCDTQRSVQDLSLSLRCIWYTTFSTVFTQLPTNL